MKILHTVALLTAALSAGTWVYRYIDEHTPQHWWFYVVVPGIVWLLFAGPLYALNNSRKWVRVLAIVGLVPTTALWALSVMVGIYGLRIH